VELKKSTRITNSTQIFTAPGTYTATVTQTSTGCATTSSSITITQNANEPTGTGLLGTYFIPSGGTSCRNFASIRNAVDTLNKYGIVGNVTFNVAAGFTETLTRRLDLGSVLLNGQTASGRTITFKKNGAGANPIITAYTGFKLPTDQTPDGMWSLSGVDNVTIDGRVNATGTAKDLVISNTSALSTAGTSTLRFIGDASNNTVKYCSLKGSSTDAAAGIVFFSTATTTGNDNNSITNNDITSAADAARPLNAIYSAGTLSKTNSGNTISNNSIYNFIFIISIKISNIIIIIFKYFFII
jgi:hypothetical protein